MEAGCVSAVAPHDLAAEQAVLGCVLMGGHELLAKISGPEHGLRATHFHSLEHGRAYDLMLSLMDRDVPLDAITVRGAIADARAAENPQAFVDAVVAVPSVANWPAYVKTVKEKAYLRAVRTAAHLYMEASETGDLTKVAEAERLIEARQTDTAALYTPERQAEDFLERKMAPILCPWPWARFNELTGGGLRGSQLIVLAGITNFGKSPALDQIMLSGRAHSLRTALYINEMGEQERAQRLAAQLCNGDPTFEQIRDDDMDAGQELATAAALRESSVPIRDMSGWDAPSVCRDIARCGWEMVGVDILHNFDYVDQDRDLARIVSAFKSCAQRTGACIILAAHLNKGDGEANRPPVLRDLRGSGMIQNLADFVVFVHRETNGAGKPMPDGSIHIAKGRNSALGGCHATYDHLAMRWEQS